MNILAKLKWLRQLSSREVAKRRLQLVLMRDRGEISSEFRQSLKDEVTTVLSRHLEID